MRILLRAHKSPFTVAGPYRTLRRNLIGDNVGNLAFSQAAYRLLSTRGTLIDAQRLVGLTSDEVNARYDQVVVPLANAFRMGFIDELQSMTDLFSHLKIPVVVLGCGVQAEVNGKVRPSRLDDAVKAFMASVLNRSASVGVRGEITVAYLKKLGFGDDVVEVIGCPSMFMDGPHFTIKKRVEELSRDSRISLNMTPMKDVVPMSQVCRDQAEWYPNLMYIAQDRFTLTLMLTGVWGDPKITPKDAPITMSHPLFAQNRVRFCLDPSTWMAYLRQFDFSFGTRIHGNIMALLSGVPAVVLAHDSRTLELADYHEIPRRMLTTKPDGLDAAELYAATDWTATVAGHGARWQRLVGFLARNGVRHVYLPGESPQGFDLRLAATRFPAPVEVGGTWFTRREAGLRRWGRRWFGGS